MQLQAGSVPHDARKRALTAQQLPTLPAVYEQTRPHAFPTSVAAVSLLQQLRVDWREQQRQAVVPGGCKLFAPSGWKRGPLHAGEGSRAGRVSRIARVLTTTWCSASGG